MSMRLNLICGIFHFWCNFHDFFGQVARFFLSGSEIKRHVMMVQFVYYFLSTHLRILILYQTKVTVIGSKVYYINTYSKIVLDKHFSQRRESTKEHLYLFIPSIFPLLNTLQSKYLLNHHKYTQRTTSSLSQKTYSTQTLI